MSGKESKRKRQRSNNGSIPNKSVMDSLFQLHPNVSFSEGAVEGIRMALHQYLDSMAAAMASELDGTSRVLQHDHVFEAMTRIGIDKDAVERTMEHTDQTDSGQPVQARKKSKGMKWTKEMEAEQERLLSKSLQKRVDGGNNNPIVVKMQYGH